MSVRPRATAADATAAAVRAARSSGAPLASSAASVAEWVQPAPCVAAMTASFAVEHGLVELGAGEGPVDVFNLRGGITR